MLQKKPVTRRMNIKKTTIEIEDMVQEQDFVLLTPFPCIIPMYVVMNEAFHLRERDFSFGCLRLPLSRLCWMPYQDQLIITLNLIILLLCQKLSISTKNDYNVTPEQCDFHDLIRSLPLSEAFSFYDSLIYIMTSSRFNPSQTAHRQAL